MSLRKAATFLVADLTCQLDGFSEVHPHLPRRVGVGAERDGHAILKCELKNFAAGINFPAILAQTGGVEFDGAVLLFRGG